MSDADDIIWNVFVVIGAVAVIFWCVHASCEESDRRAVIRARCEPVRHISGDVITTYNGKDVGVAFVGDKTCYRCPDGFEECF